MEIEFRWVTPNAEAEIAYMTRGSNPPNQNNPEWEKLFNHCLGRTDKHWSVLQMSNLCVGVKTSLAIAAQFKRHWALACHGPEDMQETSFRYMSPTDYDWGYEPIELRYQAVKNRQSSTDVLTGQDAEIANRIVNDAILHLDSAYKDLIKMGVARECARFILPTATTTRFYVNGTARTWTTYFIQRLSPHAQKEHRELAEALYEVFEPHFPTVCGILFRRTEEGVYLIDPAAEKIAALQQEVERLKAELRSKQHEQ